MTAKQFIDSKAKEDFEIYAMMKSCDERLARYVTCFLDDDENIELLVYTEKKLSKDMKQLLSWQSGNIAKIKTFPRTTPLGDWFYED